MAGSVRFVGINSNFGNSATITVPSGTTGDILVGSGSGYDGSGALSGSSAFAADFTQIDLSVVSPLTFINVYQRQTDGTEDASYAMGWTSGTYGEMSAIVRISAGALQATSGGVFKTNADHDIPALTVDTDGSLAVAVAAGYNNAVTDATWTGAGWTRRATQDSNFQAIYTKSVDAGAYSSVAIAADFGAMVTVLVFEPVPPMNVIATDDFNRANENPLSDGGSWTNDGWGNLAVVGNAVVNTVSGQWAYSVRTGDALDNDQWTEATIGAMDGAGGDAGVFVRAVISGGTASVTGYGLYLEDGGRAIIREFTSGGSAILANTAYGFFDDTVAHTARIEAVGTTITAYIDGVEALAVTDASITSGYAAISILNSTTASIDNFSAGDWAEPAPPPPLPSITITTKFAGDVNSSSERVDHSAANVDCGTVTTGALLIVTVAGTVYDDAFHSVTKSSGTATLGTITRLADPVYIPYSAYVRTSVFTIPVISGGTLVLSTDDSNATWGWGCIVEEVTGYDTGIPITGLVTKTDNGNRNPTNSTLSSAPRTGDVTYAVGCFDADTGSNSIAPGSGWTERAEVSAVYTLMSSNARVDSTSTDVDWPDETTPSGDVWSFAGVAFIIREAPNVIATDDFNRANEGLEASSNWSTHKGTSGTLDVVSNHVEPGATATSEWQRWVTDELDSDHWAQADVTATGGASYNEGGVVVRASASGNDGYYGSFTTDAGGTFYIYQGDSTLASSPGSQGTGTKTVRLEAVTSGSDLVLTLYADGVEVITYTDTTPSTGTYAGIGMYRSSTTMPTLDNFSAGDWSEPAPPPVEISSVGSYSLTVSDIGQLTIIGITDYLVQYRTTSGPGVWQTFSDGVNSVTGAAVTGLTPGVSYDFRVAAINTAGTGLWSNVATVTAGSSGVVNLKLGDTQISAIKLGDIAITKAYLGDIQILG